MSDLLYLDEHISCRHYVSDYRCNFKYHEMDDGDELQFEDRPHHYLAFLLEGEQIMDCNEFKERHFKAGDIVFIPSMAKFSGKSLGKGRMLVCLFDIPKNVCDKFNLQSYWPLNKDITYDFRPVKIVPQMETFVKSLVYYLQQGVNCEHFHELKQQEMFLNFRWFYTKDELAELFYPMVGRSLNFKALIMEYYNKVDNVQQLAEFSCMSRSTFDEAFKREFGIPAGKWMLQQKAQHLMHRMSEPGVTLSDIMLQFGFNSPPELTRFCKQHFGQTPSEIMQNINDR